MGGFPDRAGNPLHHQRRAGDGERYGGSALLRFTVLAGLSLAALTLSASPPQRFCIRSSSLRMAVSDACAWRGQILIAGWRSLPDYRSARPVRGHLTVATLNPTTLAATGRSSVAIPWATIWLACTPAGPAYLGVGGTVYQVRAGPRLEPTLSIPGKWISGLAASGGTIAVLAGVPGKDKFDLIVARYGRLIGGIRAPEGGGVVATRAVRGPRRGARGVRRARRRLQPGNVQLPCDIQLS